MTSQHSLEVVFLQRFAVHSRCVAEELCKTCECRAITYGDLVELLRRDIAIIGGPESEPLSPATDRKVGPSRRGTGRSLRLVAACVVSPEPNRSLTAGCPRSVGTRSLTADPSRHQTGWKNYRRREAPPECRRRERRRFGCKPPTFDIRRHFSFREARFTKHGWYVSCVAAILATDSSSKDGDPTGAFRVVPR